MCEGCCDVNWLYIVSILVLSESFVTLLASPSCFVFISGMDVLRLNISCFSFNFSSFLSLTLLLEDFLRDLKRGEPILLIPEENFFFFKVPGDSNIFGGSFVNSVSFCPSAISED